MKTVLLIFQIITFIDYIITARRIDKDLDLIQETEDKLYKEFYAYEIKTDKEQNIKRLITIIVFMFLILII